MKNNNMYTRMTIMYIHTTRMPRGLQHLQIDSICIKLTMTKRYETFSEIQYVYLALDLAACEKSFECEDVDVCYRFHHYPFFRFP